ncbi:hypothetical protein BD410DRAFT_787821 [Rickenella mellea]|uniref:N-acetyltransferase domain-containing protein n=1 Tax=Rickenella mellea TaxID=50990 RepID=A0A4Y7Q6R0_9AGAM|nr:hypothetical protein BD410DRAFT_787821 [Rickenella mellea]
MSAYGAFSSPVSTAILPSTVWYLPPKNSASRFISIHHLRLSTATSPGFIEHLHREFAEEVARGTSYPQETREGETLSREAFEAYFFAESVIVGIVHEGDLLGLSNEKDTTEIEGMQMKEVVISSEDARAERAWEECVAGFYYVKPNYPGRSSHICNAGFITPSAQRGRGYGHVMARSFLYYAPRLGYAASVFNLVFVNNLASIRLWEQLRFTKTGLIPRAGRLKRTDGQGEEYVDAYVFYKDFRELAGYAGDKS